MHEKAKQIPETYDAMYDTGGFGGAYALPYRHTWFYPMYKAVLRRLRANSVENIIEVGCGSGAFAHMLLENTNVAYQGFDFSESGVRQAVTRTGRSDAFYVADATRPESYRSDYDCVVCTEVLEHIERDLDVISLWRPGTYCICSVPNFDATTHVRHFRNETEVRNRYGSLISIEHIERVRKPAIPDISLSSRLRNIRWNRYRPDRLIGLLGLGTFQSMGGWFVFAGRRVP